MARVRRRRSRCRRRTVAASYPDVAAVNPYFKPPHYETTFLLGLDMLFDGLEAASGRKGAGGEAARAEGKARRRQTRFAASEIIT